mmetsp:Transcript_55685/g.129672  ORF Transcript_55685/g.129672 Transcript_55685/m.129672 type:complete len:364 (+) Transcript_55685:39-1130(+)|eukprot:CAMPEP_0171106404 /NCGR_PEP_ID=MMETSP0766_2-20121228/64666_1 /TAXON_ID=439317 /ORGANISM="Gambierdiscus australes, Strain CAWD 149" /LENGTH=363 /DNA_ID=CAMNT_0011567489 /DNA_START=33 /DNA_END=1124 /DNA_ORIENTATION=-
MGAPLVLSPEQVTAAIPTVLRFSQAHFVSQCLLAFVKLGIPDVIGNEKLAVEDIAKALPEGTVVQALGRMLRVLTCHGVVDESAGPHGEFMYSLTTAGALLQTKAQQLSLACGVVALIGQPMWSTFGLLPDHIEGKTTADPFEQHCHLKVHDAMKIPGDEYAASLNEFASFFSTLEMEAVFKADFLNELSGKTLVDLGGHRGDPSPGTMMGKIAKTHPGITCVAFDLPQVIEKAGEPPEGVTFAKGDVFDASTIPKADGIFMKHMLADFSDGQVERILANCHEVLPDGGRIFLGEPVLPAAGAITLELSPTIFFDFLLMVVGGCHRTHRQWDALAKASGFQVIGVEGNVPLCRIITLEKILQI